MSGVAFGVNIRTALRHSLCGVTEVFRDKVRIAAVAEFLEEAGRIEAQLLVPAQVLALLALRVENMPILRVATCA